MAVGNSGRILASRNLDTDRLQGALRSLFQMERAARLRNYCTSAISACLLRDGRTFQVSVGRTGEKITCSSYRSIGRNGGKDQSVEDSSKGTAPDCRSKCDIIRLAACHPTFYHWTHGIHVKVHLQDDANKKQGILVLMGATADVQKELIALFDGNRESEQSWCDLRVDLKQRGLIRVQRFASDGVRCRFGGPRFPSKTIES